VLESWDKEDGRLTLKSRASGSKAKSKGVYAVLYGPIFCDGVASIDMLNEQDLLDYVTLLYSIRENLKKETS
jgi:hypothetical protein